MHPITTVFLDRDGVINRKPEEGRYVTRWEEFEFLPGAIDALRYLGQAGIRVIVVTNQRGIASGHMTQAAVDEIHSRMVSEIRRAGGRLDVVLVCPHLEGTCDCRKPAIGLFRQAEAIFPEIDLATSIVVGDSSSDIEAGNRLGCRTFLVGAPDRRSENYGSTPRIDGEADSLFDLVRAVLDPSP